MKSEFFIDIHCHPSIKPYARSFRKNAGKQSLNPANDTSIWYADNPSLFDKVKNYAVSLTNFIQSDGTNLYKGRVAVVCLSLYSQEKGFFDNKLGTGFFADLLTKLATEFGQERIDFIQQHSSYWDDFKMETKFLLDGENKSIRINHTDVKYIVARSFSDIDMYDRAGDLGTEVIIFVPTIEGLHIFDQVMDHKVSCKTHARGVAEEFIPTLIERVRELRTGSTGLLRPAFVTLAHHFWNGLCGHARSLGGMVKCAVNQDNGADQGFSEAGKLVVQQLLGEQRNEQGALIPMIPIDIKHMSRKSREEYFALLEKDYSSAGVPVLCSHGGVTGRSAPGGNPVTPAAQEGLFMLDDINLFDDELLKIEATSGIFGIQLDERRIGSKQALSHARGNLLRRDILFSWSKLVWNQVRHIAELLDMHGKYAWGIQCLGTDFDGIIDPINGYWTAASMDDLDDYLLKHAFNYLKETKVACPLKQEFNRKVSPDEVVERVMTSNAVNFLATYFR